MSINSLSGMRDLRTLPTPEENDKKLKDVSSLYEKQFLREMMKAMRGTVHESGLIKVSQGEQIFREQLDGEYVDKWAEKGGIGLADLIHEQLLAKYGAKMGIKAPIERPKGPIQLNEKSNFIGRALDPSSELSRKTTYRFDRLPNNSSDLQEPGLGASLGADALKAPWDGLLTSSKKVGADEYLLEMNHENGLKSQMVFRGLPMAGLNGTQVQAGQTIGVLGPEAKSFFWTLENPQAPTPE